MSELIESTRRRLEEPPAPPLALQRAVAAVPEPTVGDSLQAVAEELPLAVSAEFANVRLLAPDGRLYLTAASGCTPGEARTRAFQPLDVEQVLAMLGSGAHEKVAAALGIRSVHVAWMEADGDAIGAVAVGSRTKRTPGVDDVRLLEAVARRLAVRLAPADRSVRTLRRWALAVAKRHGPESFPSDGRVAELRPRERVILELYADGLATTEIADLLGISPHTVRTHVKLALRRVGARSRDEAATLVRADQTGQII